MLPHPILPSTSRWRPRRRDSGSRLSTTASYGTWVLGERLFACSRLGGRLALRLAFQDALVSRPVLSAVRLAPCGLLSRFESGSAHVQGPDGSLFDLDRRGQVYLLPARVLDRPSPNPLRSCLKQSNDRGRGKTMGLAPFAAGGSSGSGLVRGSLPAKAAEEQEPREQQRQQGRRQQPSEQQGPDKPPQPHWRHAKRPPQQGTVFLPSDWRAHQARVEPPLPEGPVAEAPGEGGSWATLLMMCL